MLKLVRGQLGVSIRGLFLDPQCPRGCEDTSVSQQVWEVADERMTWEMEAGDITEVAGSVTCPAVRPCVVTWWFCQHSSHCAVCADHAGRRMGWTIFLLGSMVALKSNCSAGAHPV